jgi:antitoxin HicB
MIRNDTMAHIYKIPLVLTAQPEGDFTVTSPTLPELITEEDTVGEAIVHAQGALRAVLELYEDLGRPLPLPRGQGR